MRKVILSFIGLAFIIATNVWAFDPPPDRLPDGTILAMGSSLMVAGGGAPAEAPGGDCPEGTYLFYWDGDHSSGKLIACVDSGNSTLEGTNDGTDRIATTNGEGDGDYAFEHTWSGHYIEFAIASWDIFPDPSQADFAVTVCARAKVVTPGGDDAAIWEVYGSAANYIWGRAENDSGGEIEFWYYVDNHPGDYESVKTSLSYDTYQDYVFTCDFNETGSDFSVSANKGSSYTDEDQDLTEWSVSTEDNLKIGGETVATGTGTSYITKFAVISGYKQDCPW